jgi:hypothetical protein
MGLKTVHEDPETRQLFTVHTFNVPPTLIPNLVFLCQLLSYQLRLFNLLKRIIGTECAKYERQEISLSVTNISSAARQPPLPFFHLIISSPLHADGHLLVSLNLLFHSNLHY